MTKIRVLIADDHPLIRSGVRGLLEGHPDIEITGEVANFPELWSALEALPPRVVLLDLRMPGGVGLDAVARMCRLYPAIRILILSSFPEETFVLRVIRAGAAGYLQKAGPLEMVAEAVRVVASGELYVSEAAGRVLARAAMPGSPGMDASALSDREFEVLRLLGSGVAPGEIAERLYLSVKTISTYRSRLMEKMGFASNADIIRYVIENGLAE